MSFTAVSIQHTPRELPDDLVSRLLKARGWQIEYFCPPEGESLPNLNDGRFDAAVVFGGLESANDSAAGSTIPAEIDWVGSWLASGRPLFGICLGAQMMAMALGARVVHHPRHHHEIGFYPVTPTDAGKSFLPKAQNFYQWHQEGFELPDGSTLLAGGEAFPNQAFRFGQHAYGVQFHPEVSFDTISRWLGSGVSIDYPGAISADQQRRDAERYLPDIEAWLSTFVDQWLSDANLSDRL